MFMYANKKTTLKLRDKTVDLKETKDLYSRLMVLARSSRDINQKDAIGNHEFTVTPRALFASDGTILPCLNKWKFIHLNNLTTAETPQEAGPNLEQRGPVRKKMWGPFKASSSLTGAADPIFVEKLATFFCSSLAVHSGIAHFSGIQKFTAPFVGPPFCGAPVQPNMLNMPKSAADRKISSQKTGWTPHLLQVAR